MSDARALPAECQAAIDEFRGYVEGGLSLAEKRKLETHLAGCAHCREELEANRSLFAIMDTTLGARSLAPNFDERAEAMLKQTPSHELPAEVGTEEEYQEGLVLEAMDKPNEERGFMALLQGSFGSAPWWGVSVVLHGLVIALAGLISMSMNMPQGEEAVVMMTELQARKDVEIEQEKKAVDKNNPLESKHETPPTDPTSAEASDIVVPPDILARAEIGDHFETINPDRPDTQSAFGNPDAHVFHSVKGNDEPEGGGGTGGMGFEDVIGVGGEGTKGTGGGWGGGKGTGMGTGEGSGRGSFGNRNGGGRRLMVKRHGGSKATETAVDKGLEWLVRNQEADGSWNNQKHGGKHQGAVGDAAMTGYAVLAFLGAGHTERVGKYKENVQKGVKWLIDNQKDGRWYPLNYTQGIATMALAEAAAMAKQPDTVKAAQAAIDAVDKAQIQTGGTSDREAWDYHPKGATNDSSIMAWNILALKSAKVGGGGLKVELACFEGCLNWLNAGQDLGDFKPGQSADPYWEGGMMSYRGTCANPNKGKGSMAVTAAAGLCRLMIGGAAADDPGVVGPCNLILKKHIPKQYPFDMYFGYYATLLMFQKGGEHWKGWNEAMKKALCDAQAVGGADDGSWDPTNAGHCDGSRVMSTCLSILCLEVYYRYAKLAGAGK